MKTIIGGLLALHLATIIKGDKCCFPKQFEANQYGKGDLFRASSIEAEKIYYDATNKKFAAVGVYVKDQIRTEAKVISDHNTKKLYLIKVADRECTVSTFTSPDYPEICIPDDAKEFKSSYFGIGNDKLDVTAFTFKFNQGLFDVDVFLVATKTGDECVPVSADAIGKYNGTKYYEILNFLEVKSSISDDTIFNPPDYCTSFWG